MILKKEAVVTQNNGQYTVTLPDNGSSFSVGEITAFLISVLQNGSQTKEQLLHALLNRYDISTVLALNEIDLFLKIMGEHGLVTD